MNSIEINLISEGTTKHTEMINNLVKLTNIMKLDILNYKSNLVFVKIYKKNKIILIYFGESSKKNQFPNTILISSSEDSVKYNCYIFKNYVMLYSNKKIYVQDVRTKNIIVKRQTKQKFLFRINNTNNELCIAVENAYFAKYSLDNIEKKINFPNSDYYFKINKFDTDDTQITIFCGDKTFKIKIIGKNICNYSLVSITEDEEFIKYIINFETEIESCYRTVCGTYDKLLFNNTYAVTFGLTSNTIKNIKENYYLTEKYTIHNWISRKLDKIYHFSNDRLVFIENNLELSMTYIKIYYTKISYTNFNFLYCLEDIITDNSHIELIFQSPIPSIIYQIKN